MLTARAHALRCRELEMLISGSLMFDRGFFISPQVNRQARNNVVMHVKAILCGRPSEKSGYPGLPLQEGSR